MMIEYSKIPDADLLTLLKAGDQSAFRALYDRYWGVLYRHARKILRNDEEVSDIVQEVFLILLTKASSIELTTSLSAYLYSSTRNRILNYLDKAKVREKYIASLSAYFDKGEFTTDNQLREKEMAALIEKEIAALPEKMREVFELSRKSNLSYKEIGEQLGLADSTVKNQMSKALKTLKLKFGSIIILYLLLHL